MSGQDVPGFSPGDKVWPVEGPMILQRAPQTVIATYRHPVSGDWLRLAAADCPRGFPAAHWTTEEPDEGEQVRRRLRNEELAARWRDHRMCCEVPH